MTNLPSSVEASLRSRLHALQVEVGRLRNGTAYSALRGKYDELSARAERWKASFEEAKAARDALKAEADALRKEKRALEKSVAEMERKAAKFDEEEGYKALSRSLSSEVRVLERENSQLKAERKGLKEEIAALRGKLAAAQAEKAALGDKLAALGSDLAKAESENGKMKVQIGKNPENSGCPTSARKNPFTRKPQNNREKTGRKRGAQPGHKGHKRKEAPSGEWAFETYTDLEFSPEEVARLGLTPLDRYKEKKEVGVFLAALTTKFHARLYRTPEGKIIHAPFPEGLSHNETSYSPSLKALLYQVLMGCNVSVRNAAQLVSGLTNGQVAPSTGFIHSLYEEFANKSKREIGEIFEQLLSSSVMHVDFTGAFLDGANKNILVSTDGKNALFQYRDHKGLKGVAGSPAENYSGTLVHDHDLTFYNFGGSHQECLVHIRRALKESMQYEGERGWAQRMLRLLDEMMKLTPEERADLTSEKVMEYEERYDTILKAGLKSYKTTPPLSWYPNGKNLCLRLRDYKKDTLRFLYHPDSPTENNRAETLCRTFKRKQQQMTTFRSKDGADDICAGLSVMQTCKASKGDIHDKCLEVFGREWTSPKRKPKKMAASAPPGGKAQN